MFRLHFAFYLLQVLYANPPRSTLQLFLPDIILSNILCLMLQPVLQSWTDCQKAAAFQHEGPNPQDYRFRNLMQNLSYKIPYSPALNEVPYAQKLKACLQCQHF